MTSRLVFLVTERALRGGDAVEPKIGVACRLWVLVNCTRISSIKAESGDNPSFQLCSHREYLPRMTMFSNHRMQGKSDAEKDML